MGSIKRVSLVATLALAALALTAASASADIVDPVSGDPYVGDVAGVNTGANPTLVTSTVTITCANATTGGTMDGNAPATAELDFTWSQCNIAGQPLVSCTVGDINDVSVDISEAPAAPDATIINTERGATQITCVSQFNCNASSDPDDNSGLTDNPGGTGSEVTAQVAGGSNPVATISDDVVVVGTGCPSQGTWNAQYLITEPADGLESNN